MWVFSEGLEVCPVSFPDLAKTHYFPVLKLSVVPERQEKADSFHGSSYKTSGSSVTFLYHLATSLLTTYY